MIKTYLAAAVSVFALVACSAEDDDSAQQDADVQGGTLDASASGGFYRVVGQDQRECIAATCGGLYLSKVNGAVTRCADGKVAKRCLVGRVDLSELGLSAGEEVALQEGIAQGDVLLRAEAPSFDVDGREVLTAFEAWQRLAPDGSAPRGTLQRITDSGVRCITTPCPSLRATKVNGYKSFEVTGVRWEQLASQPSEQELESVWNDLAEPHGFLIASRDQRAEQRPNAVYQLVRSRGAVDVPCGGRAGNHCPDGTVCVMPEGSLCGRADAQGVCKNLPDDCDAGGASVCGCDGQSYASACAAAEAGVALDEANECRRSDEPCYVGGCSGQVCAASRGLLTSCEWRAEYACYQGASCERQRDGSCGWTKTQALTSCLENAR